jgi:hypothetical protein
MASRFIVLPGHTPSSLSQTAEGKPAYAQDPR